MKIVRPAEDAEFREALARVMAQPGLSQADLNDQIDRLLRHAERHELSLEHCLIARDGERMIAACLCVDSAGRTSSAFIPAIVEGPEATQTVIRLLAQASSQARDRNVQLLQAVIRPDAQAEAELYRAADFERLTQLIYLDDDLTRPVLSGKHTPAVTWVTYSSPVHGLFARVVQGTYEGSLDCGSLNGVRDVEDILASHRATGEFDPRFWLVGMVDSEPIGVLLLGYMPDRSSCEVVYMGLLPAWRGRGYGAALLRRAVERTRDQAAMTLTLAVDAGNAPARRLYRSFGFREVSRRDVWIKILYGRSADDDTSRSVRL